MLRHVFYLSVALSAFGINPFLLCSCVSAQEKTINEKVIKEKEFKEIQAKATERLRDKIYRLTKTEERFSERGAKPQSVKINILETVPPNKRRELEEIKSPTENSKTERIWDGKNLYKRENDGEWEKYSGGGGGSGDFASGKITTTYKFIEKTTLNNQIVNVYEVETNRIANKFSPTSRYEVHYVEKTRYWINEDGYFLNITKESEIAGSKSLKREIEIYEYDPNIKIEAPVK
jgi:hypothetical protein